MMVKTIVGTVLLVWWIPVALVALGIAAGDYWWLPLTIFGVLSVLSASIIYGASLVSSD